jgi:hypothetical protein
MATRTSTRVKKAPPKPTSPDISSSDDAPTVKKSTKRSRPMARVDANEEAGSASAARPAKRSRTTKTPAQITEAAADKAKLAQEKLEKKAAKEAAAAEKKVLKDAATAKKAEEKQRKEKWRVWIINNDAGDKRFKADPADHETLTQTNCKALYGVTPEELKTLAHDEVFNSHNPKMPGKVFKKEEVQQLAFRKSAVLAGVEEDNDEELVKQGKAIFEEKHE